MRNDITKYIRDVASVATTLRKIMEAGNMDPTLQKEMREDLVWELARLGSYMADSMAALINLSQRYPNSADL